MTSNVVRLRSIPLWEKKWGEKKLRARCANNIRSFERGFRLRAFSDDELIFPSWEKCRVPGLVLGEIIRNDWPTFTGVDLSGKKRPGNAISSVKVDPSTRRRYLVDIRFGAWKATETCEQISVVNSLLNPTVIMVEDNAYQETLMDWISDDKSRFAWWMKVEPTTTTGGKKGDLEKGVRGLEVEFARQGWVIPFSEYEGATPEEEPPRGHWARLDHEFRFYPLYGTSDGVMATWFSRQGIELYGGFNFADYGSEGLGNLNLR